MLALGFNKNSGTTVADASGQNNTATWDGATLRLYVNSVQVVSRAVAGTLAAMTNPLRIGSNAK